MNIRKTVRQTLNEEYGINDKVLDATNYVLSTIEDNVKKIISSNSDIVDNVVGRDRFEFTCDGNKIKVSYMVYFFETKDEFINYYKNVDPDIRNAVTFAFNDHNKFIITLRYVVCNQEDYYNLIYEHVQHELNHVFQQIFMGKPYERGKIQNNISSNKHKIMADKDLRCAKFILYMSSHFEQDAFVNGLYSALLNLGGGGTIDVIENCGAVHNFRTLQGALGYLSTIEDNGKFSEVFGISKRRILKIGLKSSRRLWNLINRVIFKYNKDTDNEIPFLPLYLYK